MARPAMQTCEFETARLRVGPWHSLASEAGVDLEQVVAGMLTERTTQALPEAWHGDFTIERARAWVGERDAESPTLLILDQRSAEPRGFAILFEVPVDEAVVDLRIGYVFAEPAWGHGLATEFVEGLVGWARSQPAVRTLTGGVADTNPASARVLLENGFCVVADTGDGEATYQLSVDQGTEWDAYAATWDQDVAARAYADAAYDSLRNALEARRIRLDGTRICDFGCGTGLLTEQLAGSAMTIDAIDVSSAMLEVLDDKVERRGWRNVRTMSALPETGPAYDLIVCSSVCSFLDDYPATVGKLVSVLRPGGLFVQWDWERDADDPDSHGLTRQEIVDALTSAALDAVSVETAFDISIEGQHMRPVMGHGLRPGLRGEPDISPRARLVS